LTELRPTEQPHTPPFVAASAGAPSRGGYADFEVLLRAIVGGAFATALRLTRNRQDAEDLVQEAALAAYRGYATFAVGSNFKAWFYTILMHCFYATSRKVRTDCSIQDVEDAHEMYLYERAAAAGLLGSPDPVHATVGRLAADDIAAALASLPNEFRITCTMYFMEDFSYDEIARMLGLPLGTVRSRLHRGRRMLQKRLWTLAVDQGIVCVTGTVAARAPSNAPSSNSPSDEGVA
jgi:RNA polymerase sigma-70 factor (ECF subfamily)